MHNIDIQNYRGTLIVNSGAWQAQTEYLVVNLSNSSTISDEFQSTKSHVRREGSSLNASLTVNMGTVIFILCDLP